MTDESSRTSSFGLDDPWSALARQGYVLTNDEIIGLPKKFRQSFLSKYFNDRVLHHDEGDWPIDRKRARDVIQYHWRDDELHLREHDVITLTDRAGIPVKREHSRVWLLDDPEVERFVRIFLGLVPPGRRQNDGTFGVNLFRTFTHVVSKPHQTNEEYVMLYVLNRIGCGAESYLYRPEDVMDDGEPTAEPVRRHRLDPGEILIFEDRLFKHGATPLEPLSDGTAQRDVLVCTVDYRSTYLEPSDDSLRVG